MSNDKSNLVELTGLWLNQTKAGDQYFSGYFGRAKVLIFKNKYKDKEKDPDYKLYIAPGEKPEGGKVPQKGKITPAEPEPEFGDVPF